MAKALGVAPADLPGQSFSDFLTGAVKDSITNIRQGEQAAQGSFVVFPACQRPAIERLADVFCEFWSHDAAIGRLTEAAGTDAEFAQTLAARNERRRKSLTILVERAAPKGARAKEKRDTVDMIFALTSYAVFAMLSDGRSPAAAAALVKAACRQALDRLTEED